MNPKNSLVTIASLILVLTAVAYSGSRSATPSVGPQPEVDVATPGESVLKPQIEPCRDLELANAAIDSGDFLLADHYARRLVNHGADVIAIADLIVRLAVKQSDFIISNRDWEDIRVFQRNCNEAVKVNDEAVLVMQMLLQRELEASAARETEVAFLRKAITQLAENEGRLLIRRKAGFDVFANTILNTAHNKFRQGKGAWYENDDETQFQNALIMMQWCWTVDTDLSPDTRSQLFDLQTQIKNELSEADYDESLNRFRIVAGTLR